MECNDFSWSSPVRLVQIWNPESEIENQFDFFPRYAYL
jgi:hypothetical protein